MTDSTSAKRALARLATGPPSDRGTIERAERARTDLVAAERFVAAKGLVRLRRAVERTGEGEATLAAYERYRAACQFRPAHATDLSAGPKERSD